MLEIAVRMAGSPLISTDNPMGSEKIRNATGNAQSAMLANAAAGHHLAELAGRQEDRERQDEILRISRPHLDVTPAVEWEIFRGGGMDRGECEAIVDTRGLLMHGCPATGDEEQPFPCPSCPTVISRLPGIVMNPAPPERRLEGSPAESPGPQPVNEDRAQQDAASILEALERIAGGLGEIEPPARRDLAAALILMANTAYHTAAAAEWYGAGGEEYRHDSGPNHLRMARLHLKLYELLGGTDLRPMEPREDGTRNFCTMMSRVTTGETHYLCDPPSGRTEDEVKQQGGTSNGKCSECPYLSIMPRPQPEELIPQRLMDD